MKRLLTSGLAALVGLSTALVPASAEAKPRLSGAIVFISDRDSPSPDAVQDDVYLFDTRTGRTSRLTDDPQVERFPRLSPDGRYLAYASASFPGVQVCRVVRAGSGWTCTSPRPLVGYPGVVGGNWQWTPDGRSVVFGGQTVDEPDGDIYRISLEGFSPAENLTDEKSGDAEIPEFQPTVSPDGRHVVYTRDGDLWRRGIDGSDPVRLTNTPQPVQEYGAEYSPDGRTLAFHSNRKAPVDLAIDDVDVYVMAPRRESATNVVRDLTSGLTAPGGGPSRERFPSFSPDGSRIAFWWSVGGGQSDFDTGEIYTVRPDGSDPVDLTANNPTDPAVPSVGDIFPDWGRVRR